MQETGGRERGGELRIWGEGAKAGNYEAWGVRFPNGKIREFSTREKAVRFTENMEGRDVVQADGTWETWIGLTVVHRFIPAWEEVDLSGRKTP